MKWIELRCDVCGERIPKRVGCSLDRYKVKIKCISQYSSIEEKGLPSVEKVDLCPECFRNLCEGLIDRRNGER